MTRATVLQSGHYRIMGFLFYFPFPDFLSYHHTSIKGEEAMLPAMISIDHRKISPKLPGEKESFLHLRLEITSFNDLAENEVAGRKLGKKPEVESSCTSEGMIKRNCIRPVINEAKSVK